jgi:hypothetical protein
VRLDAAAGERYPGAVGVLQCAARANGAAEARPRTRRALAGLALSLVACGRFGYGWAELGDPLLADAGTGPGGSANASGAGGLAGTGVGGSAAAGAGGSAGAAGSSDIPSPVASDAAADGGDVIDGDAGLGPAGCAPDVPLRQRPEADPPVVVAGVYDSLNPGWSRLARNTEWFELQGQGYVALRWEIEYATRAGQINPPTVTSSGTFLRVGGGGGYHLDDARPGTTGTYMGNAEEGTSYMAPGADTPWHIEFYYLDGSVTLVLNETDGLHNLEFQSQPYSTLTTPGAGVYSPGIVCDRE